MASELEFSRDPMGPVLPITSVCIVADKNKVPKGFTAIVKCEDDQTDADLWRDGIFTFNRQVRYICFSRELPESSLKTPISVVTNMTIVRENDPIPHGYVAIDYTVDNREKSLRKKFVCIRTEPRDRVVDAIGEISVLAKTKKIPRDYTSAGEVDSLMICFKVVAIPQMYGLQTSASASNIEERPRPSTGLYPGLGGMSSNSSTSIPASLDVTGGGRVDAFTMKNSYQPKVKGIDGIAFKLNTRLVKEEAEIDALPEIPSINEINRITNNFNYNFATERAILS